MVGIIEEQHPDRCRLFMQWKQMDWPILVDSLNLTGIDVVPLTYLIDEHGIVRFVKPSFDDLHVFMETEYPAPEGPLVASAAVPDLAALAGATDAGTAAAWRAYGDAAFLWGGDADVDGIVGAYEHLTSLVPDDGAAHFRLGTAYRRRYETSVRQADDFRLTVKHWAAALALNPNQYIWRRRIQQYGPRLTKPYPFYDWVDQARLDIRARGETPTPLRVEPGGAEIATPSETFESALSPAGEPDPEGRIFRDDETYVSVETTVVPPVVRAGDVARVHVVLRPNPDIKAHWNNEVEPLRVWVSPPERWSIDRHDLTTPNPPEPVSTEPREVQFEVRSPEEADAGVVLVPAYALYYVCEDVDGLCVYRRQDLRVRFEIEG